MLAATLNRSSDLGDSSTGTTNAPALVTPLRPSGTEAVGLGLVYQPAALFPEMKGSFQAEATIERLEPKPSIVEAASARLQSHGGSLTEPEMRALLAQAGWPEGRDTEEALRVAWGESKWSNATGDSGNSLGIFQLNGDTWSRYCQVPRDSLLTDPLVNARCARLVFEYEQARGYARWSNWSVKP